MEWLRSWLLSITCAAMIAAVADALCPKGFPKTLTRMAGGLLLLLAALSPIRSLDENALSQSVARLSADQSAVETVAQEDMIKSIIAQETAAYISDKAAGLGITQCRVEVRCRVTDEGFPAPESVRVEGCGDDHAWRELSRTITADFAIEPEAQTLERVDAS